MKTGTPPRTPYLVSGIPHAADIRLTVLEEGAASVVCMAPYDTRLVGNPETGVVHGGLVTTMLDSACGIAVMLRTGRTNDIATLDLRIDYMRPAASGKDIYAHAECFKVTASIAFVRGVAYEVDRNDPVATCAAAFMLGAKSRRGANLPTEGHR